MIICRVKCPEFTAWLADPANLNLLFDIDYLLVCCPFHIKFQSNHVIHIIDHFQSWDAFQILQKLYNLELHHAVEKIRGFLKIKSSAFNCRLTWKIWPTGKRKQLFEALMNNLLNLNFYIHEHPFVVYMLYERLFFFCRFMEDHNIAIFSNVFNVHVGIITLMLITNATWRRRWKKEMKKVRKKNALSSMMKAGQVCPLCACYSLC